MEQHILFWCHHFRVVHMEQFHHCRQHCMWCCIVCLHLKETSAHKGISNSIYLFKNSVYSALVQSLYLLNWSVSLASLSFSSLEVIKRCIHMLYVIIDKIFPHFKTLKTLHVGDQAFCVTAPKLWNKLPQYIRSL
jgi:hypothetical protein